MQEPLNDSELTQWRDEMRELDATIEECLWKLGKGMTDGIKAFGKPAKEFSHTFKTPPSITNVAVHVHKTFRDLESIEGLSFAIARELSALKDDQARFDFYDEAVEASGKHMDPSEFRKLLRQKMAISAVSPNGPKRQPVKQIREVIEFLKSQPQSFWIWEMRIAWLRELQPIVDFCRRLSEQRPQEHSQHGFEAERVSSREPKVLVS